MKEHNIFKFENCVVVNCVAQTPRDMRHAAGDFRRDGNEKHKISMQ